MIVLAGIAAALLVASALSELARRPGLAFAISAVAIVALFVQLYRGSCRRPRRARST